MRNYAPKRPALDPCPVEQTLAVIQSKWTARLLYLLLNRPFHFGELKRRLPGISVEVLAARLESLQNHGVVSCAKSPSPANRAVSTYRMTDKGRTLGAVLEAMAAWGEADLKSEGLHWSRPELPTAGARN